MTETQGARQPSISDLRRFLDYDPATGFFVWQNRVGPERVLNGTPALNTLKSKGYRWGRFFGFQLYAHRVAFAWVHGRWPCDGIDHVNRDRTDNRIANLREADSALNNRNIGMRRTNRSGVRGVCWCQRDKRWVATISHRNVSIRLGNFVDLEEAAKARRAAELKFGYPVGGADHA